MIPKFPQTEINHCVSLICNIVQTNAALAPTGFVFVNTIQASAWTRQDVGLYESKTGTKFEDNLTMIEGLGSSSSGGTPAIQLISTSTGLIVGSYTIYPVEETNGQLTFRIKVRNAAGAAADLNTLIGTTTISLPEMKIYNKYLS